MAIAVDAGGGKFVFSLSCVARGLSNVSSALEGR